MVIFLITRSGRIKKSQIKKKKNFLWDIFPSGFSISSDKKGGKGKLFFFSVRGERKCEKNYKKIKKIFPPFGRFFDHFLSLVCRKR